MEPAADDALEWARAQLSARGHHLAGEPQQVRASEWSCVVRLPLRAGAAWLKRTGPGCRHEALLSAEIARRAPDRVLTPLASDEARGLLLLPDGGRRLRDDARHLEPAAWEAMLAAYAELQRTTTASAVALVAAGVPDLRPARLPGLVETLVSSLPVAGARSAAALDGEELAGLRVWLPSYERMCRELEASGVGPGVQHDDLHDGNVFVADGHRFFDWGDASIAHPFLSLTVALAVAADVLGLEPGGWQVRRLRDAYLEPWTGEHDRAHLRTAAATAVRVGAPARALAWHRITGGDDGGSGRVLAWLRRGTAPTVLDPVDEHRT